MHWCLAPGGATVPVFNGAVVCGRRAHATLSVFDSQADPVVRSIAHYSRDLSASIYDLPAVVTEVHVCEKTFLDSFNKALLFTRLAPTIVHLKADQISDATVLECDAQGMGISILDTLDTILPPMYQPGDYSAAAVRFHRRAFQIWRASQHDRDDGVKAEPGSNR
jgi:hypothetical protein